jgi:hypothetical protein
MLEWIAGNQIKECCPMKDASQQQTDPRSSREHCPVIPTPLTRGVGNSAYRAVAAAAGLGLFAGLAFAITACHTTAAPTPPKPAASEPVAQSTQPAAPVAAPPSTAAPVPASVSPIDSRKKTNTVPKLLPSARKNSTRKGVGTGHKHGDGRLLAVNKGTVGHKSAKRRPYAPSAPSVAAPEQTALQLATAAAATGPFILCIEGDVTVADYEPTTGTVETFERQTYTLSKVASEGSNIPWQDFPFNVHYRCDQVGNCTLYRRGASATARLIR